jgi:5-methylthioadenosine/S-adenosylhomocysteine deaminase
MLLAVTQATCHLMLPNEARASITGTTTPITTATNTRAACRNSGAPHFTGRSIMAKKLLRITGARIAQLDEPASVLDNTDLWITDGRILALLPAGAPAPTQGPVETLAFGNALVIPGLINSHSHSASSLLRGCVGGAPLDLFVLDAQARRAPKPMRQIRVAVLLQATEMLRRGVTATVDHFRHAGLPTVEAVSAVFSAYQEVGLRAAVAPMYEDKRYIDSLPIDQAALPSDMRERWLASRPPAPKEYFAMMEEVATEWRRRDRLQLLLGVDGPQRCTPDLLELTGDFAARHGIGLHTHMLEAKTQALVAPSEHERSFVAYLDRFGLIGPKSSLAHFVWCTARDIEVAAARRVNIVNNPVSNLLLGSGLQPTVRLLEAGINVALGSDGSSGSAISLFEQAKFSMLLSRISQTDCDRWLTAPQALRMATANGAAVLGEPGALGVIHVGAHADLAIIDLSKPAYRPLGDIWNHLVMYETGENVDTVLVGGEIVYRNGRCSKVDEEELLAEAEELAAADRAANEPFLAKAHAERPVFQSLILDALRRQTSLERFARLD